MNTITLNVLDTKFKKVKDIELPSKLFQVDLNIPLIHQVVVAQSRNKRAGNATTLTRGDVRGGGKKPFKQKGTGNARQGSIRAPHMVGGGVAHGAKLRVYNDRTPKKMKRNAMLSALSERCLNDRIRIFDTKSFMSLEDKTKVYFNLLCKLINKKNEKILLIFDKDSYNKVKYIQNIPNIITLPYSALNTYSIILSDWVIFLSSSIDMFITKYKEII